MNEPDYRLDALDSKLEAIRKANLERIVHHHIRQVFFQALHHLHLRIECEHLKLVQFRKMRPERFPHRLTYDPLDSWYKVLQRQIATIERLNRIAREMRAVGWHLKRGIEKT